MSLKLITSKFCLSLLLIALVIPVTPTQAASRIDFQSMHEEQAWHRLGETSNEMDRMGAVLGASSSTEESMSMASDTAHLTDDHHNTHGEGSTKHEEHTKLFEFVSYDQATHVAEQDGAWSNPATWQGEVIPGDDARVIIPKDITVLYATTSDKRLYTVRVDGTLEFSTTQDSKMIVDTLVANPKGEVVIGRERDPVPKHISVDIVIANNGDIDVSKDPELLSRGVVLHGDTTMHGHEKTTHGKVETDPMIGDTSIRMQEAPNDWEVGDVIVIAGTHYENSHWDGGKTEWFPPEDEVRTISAISGQTISFVEPLEFDHDTPRADLKTSVGNYTRNITIQTEDPDTALIHERGHFMQMHSDDVDIRYVAFHELGRTDKINSPRNPNEFSPIRASSNVKGRYSMHFHRLGYKDLDSPAIALGNAVFGSPGWGYVHHDSNATFHNNVSYRTQGAAFVAESGNEIGSWTNNLAIFAKGWPHTAPKGGQDPYTGFDNGREGVGFVFQGRSVRTVGNIAASMQTGFNFFHRGRGDDTENGGLDGVIDTELENLPYPEAHMRDSVRNQGIPILAFKDNEVFASNHGMWVTKNGPPQGHGVKTVMDGFTAWNVWGTGASLQYTAFYVVKDFDLIGEKDRTYPFKYTTGTGISLGNNASVMSLISPTIEGFDRGAISLDKTFTVAGGDDPALFKALSQFAVVNPDLRNNGIDYVDYDPTADKILTTGDLEPDRFDVYLIGDPLMYTGLYPERRALVRGAVVDSIGMSPIAPGVDMLGGRYDLDLFDMVYLAEEEGYYENEDGSRWVVAELYLTDRTTGEIHKVGLPVRFSDASAPSVSSIYHSFKNSVLNGPLDLESEAPIVKNKKVRVDVSDSIIIDLEQGARDPDGDDVELDQAAMAEHGTVYNLGNGKVKYVPDFDYEGQDRFKFWITDKQGNFTAAWVDIGVGESAKSSKAPVQPTVNSIPDLDVLPDGMTISSEGGYYWWPREGDAPTGPIRPSEDRYTSHQTGTILESLKHESVVWYKVRFSDNTEGWISAPAVGLHYEPQRVVAHLEDVVPVSSVVKAPSVTTVANTEEVIIDDSDGDGVIDGTDNCPAEPNANQADDDQDGIGNVCDDTVTERDSDGDNIPDSADNCINKRNGNQLDTDGDGAGDACDDTNDGVLNKGDFISVAVGTPGFRTPNGVPSSYQITDDLLAKILHVSTTEGELWYQIRFAHGTMYVKADSATQVNKEVAEGKGSLAKTHASEGDIDNNNRPDEVEARIATLISKIKNNNRNNKKDKYNTLALSRELSKIKDFLNRTEEEIKVDDNYQYPLGLFEFEAEVDPGSTETITIYLDQVYDTTDWVYRKYNGTTYIDISDQVTYSTADVDGTSVTTVTYDVLDNGPLDTDDRLGFIKDPAGPGVPEAEEEDSGSSSGSSGGSSSGGSSSGGSSSGGSSSSSSNDEEDEEPTPTPTTEPAVTTTPTQSSIPTFFSFNNNISFIQPQLNQPADVRYLETFLNEFENENLTIDGIYGVADNEAMKRFQRKYRQEILDIWNLTDATGYVGITTRLKMNFLLKGQSAQCPVFTEYHGGKSDTITFSPEIGEVQKILQSLDMYTGPINNTWGPQVHESMITFQETFREVMLDPWNISQGTGRQYKTTNKFLNYFAGCDTGAVELDGEGTFDF